MKSKPKIYVTRKIPETGLKLLKKNFELTMNQEDRVLKKQEIIANMDNCDILLCLLTDTIDAEVIESNQNLKGIANYAVGYNNIDIDAANEYNIPVTNTPGVLTDTTADLAWALMFTSARRIIESDRFTRKDKFKGWAPMLFLGDDIHHKKLGIVGAGRIGTAVAKRAVGFDMEILYYNRSRNQKLEKQYNAKFCSLEKLLINSDFVSLHVPLKEDTHHLIGEKELKLMKNNAHLINTSRGAVIDEAMLAKALKENWIAGAGLDVFEAEPKVHPELIALKNVVLTPHIGSASNDTRATMAKIAAENAITIIKGNRPENLVNPIVFS